MMATRSKAPAKGVPGLQKFRAFLWFGSAVVDAALSGVEFVSGRLIEAAEDGSLRPTTAAEIAEEARRLLGLDAAK